MSFTGITVSFTSDQANSGVGGAGGAGGSAAGGEGGSGEQSTAGNPGDGDGGTGGPAGNGSIGQGGGILDMTSGSLSLEPRLGAKRGSKQAKATDVITANQANALPGGAGGAPGQSSVNRGVSMPKSGAPGISGEGSGGGIAIFGTAIIDNTTITGNQASTDDRDVLGTFDT
jgi:hypothetical protein